MNAHSRSATTLVVAGLLSLHASAAEGAAATGPPDAHALYQQSLAAMGGAAALDTIQSIRARAHCLSPTGTYVTEVRSTRDGSVWFQQSYPDGDLFTAIVRDDEAWAWEGDDPPDPMEPRMVSVVRGHEFQMMAITLTDRFDLGAVTEHAEFGGSYCHQIELTDGQGRSALAYYHEYSGLLAGLLIPKPLGAPGEMITIRYIAWRAVDGLRLPYKIVASDGTGDFVLSFREISINTVDETIFEPPHDR